jgi:hypothetical protein
VTNPLVALPDVERLLVDFLKNIPELAGVVVDNRPPAGFDGTTKAVIVSRTGGAWIDDQQLDRPLVELEIYGPTKTDAHAVSLSTRAALMQIRTTTYGGALVVDIVEESAARWLPDYNHPAGNRYLTTVRLLLRLV